MVKVGGRNIVCGSGIVAGKNRRVFRIHCYVLNEEYSVWCLSKYWKKFQYFFLCYYCLRGISTLAEQTLDLFPHVYCLRFNGILSLVYSGKQE